MSDTTLARLLGGLLLLTSVWSAFETRFYFKSREWFPFLLWVLISIGSLGVGLGAITLTVCSTN